jgi:Spy/CpxP family protein refolding chaperone
MRRTTAIVLAAMLASSTAFAQSNTNSGAGVAGKPGSKSGPATTKSGPCSSNQSGTNPDQQRKGNARKQIGTSSQASIKEELANLWKRPNYD